MTHYIRIGNAQAFWGDRGTAAAEMLQHEPELDFLTMDYLAEVSMSLLALQRERDPAAGYARDFVEVIRSLIPYWKNGGRCRVITNAGGLNPRGCAEACLKVLNDAGCPALKIGVVSGDNVLPLLQASASSGTDNPTFHNLDTGASLSTVRDRLVTGNAYLGADALVEALGQGADIVITGRVADPSLAVAACRHHFGWSSDQYQEIAGATVAGHLIECGTHVTGGISTDWLDVPDPAHLGFPIVEVAQDGHCCVTKPRDTGGNVNRETVTEQLVYEIGDPQHYLSPDAEVDFSGLKVDTPSEPNRVPVAGARGTAPPATYKVSATYRDGYRAAGTLTIFGRQAVAKARRCGEIVLQRVREQGHVLKEALVECLGTGACVPGVLPDSHVDELRETVLRIAVAADSRAAVECFARELMPLVTAGPQGTTGYAEGRPNVQPIFRYWPCLIPRTAVTPLVEILTSPGPQRESSTISAGYERDELPVEGNTRDAPDDPQTLYDIARARSGDKGRNANIGVIPRHLSGFAFLNEWLTPERVQHYFAPLGVESVERFELPSLHAFNFVLHGVLGSSLRIDAQGKTLGQALLEMPLDGAQP